MRNAVMLFFVLLFWLADHGSVSGQACPKGVRYDCVWGCGRHTDLNGDGFCDYSFLTNQAAPKVDSLPKKDTIAARSVEDSVRRLADKSDGTFSVAKERDAVTSTPGRSIERVDETSDISDPRVASGVTGDESRETVMVITPPSADHSQFQRGPVYDLILVSALTFGLYLLTFILYKRGVIKKVHHRKVWNLLLLLTFIVSCLFGLFLVVQINYNVAMKAYPTLLYWHVEVGISMALIAVIHILWHIRYFKNMFQKKW